MPVIQIENVSKCFRLQADRPRSFQELLVNTFRRKGRRACETFWALRDVSFTVEAGETLGLIGTNGSGKSTCLKLLTRILEPTSGNIEVTGRVSALLELGAGFHPDLTGRENVFLHGSVLGLSRREMTERFDDIVAFAELERFIDVPVKFYSSGMYVRLAFAIAINVNPDILLIDEVLAVGDQSFQDKCLRRVHEMKDMGVTIVYVSHGLDSVMNLCDRTLWLDNGVLCDDGMTDVVVRRYLQALAAHDDGVAPDAADTTAPVTETEPVDDQRAGDPDRECAAVEGSSEVVSLPPEAGRRGTREIEIVDVRFVDATGQISNTLATGEPMTIVLRYHAHRRIEQPGFGVAFHRKDGLHISGTNTIMGRLDIPYVEGPGEVYYRVASLPLLEGDYFLSVATHNMDYSVMYDDQRMLYPFRVVRRQSVPHEGIVYLPASWKHVAQPQYSEDGE
ncbi:MAG: ABC transporter ATP-binding protein [Anaerolineae bacterium]